MAERFWVVVILGLGLFCALTSCSSTRKLSRVDSREPAAEGAALTLSPNRVELESFHAFKALCPSEIKSFLPALVEERVKAPPCPEGLEQKFETAVPFLKLGVKSAVEEILSAQCRTINRDSGEDLLALALGRMAPSTGTDREPASEPVKEDAGAFALAQLQLGLEHLHVSRQPLDQWIGRFGDFVVPEEAVNLLQRIVVRDGCVMADEEIDTSYRTIQSLEQLAHAESEGDAQRARVEKLLSGIHAIIDRKLKEFFHR